ncbi:hypothetical protein ACFL16_00125 [Patescibacteria group bacterium]
MKKNNKIFKFAKSEVFCIDPASKKAGYILDEEIEKALSIKKKTVIKINIADSKIVSMSRKNKRGQVPF